MHSCSAHPPTPHPVLGWVSTTRPLAPPLLRPDADPSVAPLPLSPQHPRLYKPQTEVSASWGKPEMSPPVCSLPGTPALQAPATVPQEEAIPIPSLLRGPRLLSWDPRQALRFSTQGRHLGPAHSLPCSMLALPVPRCRVPVSRTGPALRPVWKASRPRLPVPQPGPWAWGRNFLRSGPRGGARDTPGPKEATPAGQVHNQFPLLSFRCTRRRSRFSRSWASTLGSGSSP